LDPDFASAYGIAANCYVWRKIGGHTTEPDQERAETAHLVRRAVDLGKDDALTLTRAGTALAYVVGDLRGAVTLIDRALQINPNLATAWHFSGWVRAFLGEPEVAIERLARARRLSPLDPRLFHIKTTTGTAHFIARRYDEAASWAHEALQEHPNF